MTSSKTNNTGTLVSIIIVNWNGRHWLEECLRSLAKQTYKHTEIILVDNASTDDSVSWTKKKFPNVKIISLDSNEGFANANNIGFESVKGEYILFLNNDTKATPTFVSELAKVLEKDPSIGGAQCKILLMDDTARLDSIGAFLTSTGFLYHYGFMNNDKKEFNKETDLYTAKGAAMMFRKSVLDTVRVNGKLFDPDYFAYFEETDLCHRVWLAGHRIVYAYKSIVYHKMGGTSTKMNNAYIQYHSFKNRIGTYIKNLELVNLIRILPVHLLCCQLFALLFIFRGKMQVSISIEKALYWNIRNIGKLLKKRKYIQTNIRTVSDSWYFQKVYRSAPFQFYLAQVKGIPFEETV